MSGICGEHWDSGENAFGSRPWDSEHLTRLRWNFLDWNFKVLQKYLKELCFQMLRVLPVRLGLHLFKVLTPDALWSTMITDDRLRSPIAYLKHLEVKPRGFLELLRLKGLVSTPSMTIWLFDYLSIELTKWYPISPHFMIIVIFMWYSCDICWFLAWCLPSPQSHQLDGASACLSKVVIGSARNSRVGMSHATVRLPANPQVLCCLQPSFELKS